jgi:hypothetical protein
MDITLFRDKSPGLNGEHVSLQDPVLLLQLSQQLFHVLFQEIQLLLENREYTTAGSFLFSSTNSCYTCSSRKSSFSRKTASIQQLAASSAAQPTAVPRALPRNPLLLQAESIEQLAASSLAQPPAFQAHF